MEGSHRIVDAWMQHPTPKFRAQLFFASINRWIKAGDSKTDITLATTLAAMDQGGVRLGLLSAWWGPQGPLISNEEVAGMIQQSPDRFLGIASVELTRPMEGVRELRRCVRQLGFRGLRILPWLWGLPPDDRRCYPLYAECVELNIPFCLQVGHSGPLCPSEPGRPIPYLENVALEFPELKIIAGHIGFPWTGEMISLALKFPNVYVDTSAYKVKRYPLDFVEFMRGPGRKKVLFGSNYPMLTPQDCLQGLDSLGLDKEAQELFLWGNASRVFSL